MKKFLLFMCVVIVHAYIQSVQAADLEDLITKLFKGKNAEISDYDDQLKEVTVDLKSYFATHDGRYIFAGPVFDTHLQKDIVSERENSRRQKYVSSQAKDTFIAYPSRIPEKYHVTVFTDIDCPYCRKLHNFMGSFNDLGISVNYIMVPRAGVGSASYKKTLTALCSDDPAASITSAMNNQVSEFISCENNILAKQMKLARELKISSTPTIVLPSGELKIGLTNPDQLLALLEKG